ncbi:hypothetical protein NIES4071_08810 [Calothrix sp. NIES-4071]|nr:hypothetical protein NIES4071_08810 [Calothrix sp. NIES-4071]BAZ55223.1 hypothetical protein NIES4105_08770 [Calothrix sp. NIES-4105]
MNIVTLNKFSWLSLLLICLAYVLVGWYLSAHHIAWLIGIFIALVALYVANKTNPLLEHLISFSSQSWLAVLFVSLIASIVFTVAIIWSMLWTLIFIPISTTVLADLEMRLAGFDKTDTFWILTVFATFGLIVGEVTDILFIPSSRF